MELLSRRGAHSANNNQSECTELEDGARRHGGREADGGREEVVGRSMRRFCDFRAVAAESSDFARHAASRLSFPSSHAASPQSDVLITGSELFILLV